MVLHLIEYCEVINQESMKSKIIQLETACDFFGFIIISIQEDKQFSKELKKFGEIVEDSFHDAPETPYLSNFMGDLSSTQMDNYEMWYVKVVRGDALKKLHEDKLCNSTP